MLQQAFTAETNDSALTFQIKYFANTSRVPAHYRIIFNDFEVLQPKKGTRTNSRRAGHASAFLAGLRVLLHPCRLHTFSDLPCRKLGQRRALAYEIASLRQEPATGKSPGALKVGKSPGQLFPEERELCPPSANPRACLINTPLYDVVGLRSKSVTRMIFENFIGLFSLNSETNTLPRLPSLWYNHSQSERSTCVPPGKLKGLFQ